ncbi:hypothetical protein J1N35_026481 [Gossypium stocksii]|uniref:Uncharacterized protein n=1 Tax=Gossypium stocksii TaxID=47602 RepID=A0A9D3V9S2_9ROSI|nr:hypothetical protein J1N35_026481 [Gossypium stocksii]
MASTGGDGPAKENGFWGLRGAGGRVTNKVRLREDDHLMKVECTLTLQKGVGFRSKIASLVPFVKWKLREGDVVKENVRGVPTIKIFKRVHHLAEQSMIRTLVLKLEN